MHCSRALLLTTALLSASSTEALPSFLKLIPGSQNVPGVQAIGHVLTGGGGALNAFGQDFDDGGRKWTVELCYKDSDSDGQFNGAELGDPCCEWVQGSNEKLAYDTATAPGDKSSKHDPSIWGSVTCANGQDPVTKFTAYANTTTAPTVKEDSVGDSSTTKVPTPSPTPSPTKSDALELLPGTALAVVVVVGGAALL